MTEEDCEIEYLDEDEDIIQQFVQTASIVEKKLVQTAPIAKKTPVNRGRRKKPVRLPADSVDETTDKDSHLIEKKNDSKRKLQSDDSDYDPTEELRPALRKRQKITRNTQLNVQVLNRSSSTPSQANIAEQAQNKLAVSKKDLQVRRTKGIRIPDFEDPLCLPVKAICNSPQDTQKLKAWNKVCLDHYKKNFEPFRPFEDPVVSSSRTIIFRKGKSSSTGNLYTMVWNKISVKDKNGKQKSDINQHTVPLFREKTILKPYLLTKSTTRRFRHKFEVLLTKETDKEEKFLVAYNPGDCVTAVYKDFKQSDMELADAEDKKPRLVIKETTCNKICAPCYQTSWRGVRKRNDTSITCAICSRTFISVYNLLSHLKTHHKHEEVRKHKAALARELAAVVDYHYKCRICQETFLSIKLLRKHVVKHQGEELFHCEIGNHAAK